MTTDKPIPITQHVKVCLLAALFLSLSFVGYSQTNKRIQGTMSDQNGEPVVGASIKLVSELDSVLTSSGSGGLFTFNNVRGQQFVLTVTSLGYDTLRREFAFETDKSELMLPVVLHESSQLLAEVSVIGVAPITVKEDTLEYATKNLRLREGALVEDALKQLDGVEVDKDGNVTAQGESVTRVRINGKDFFGGDVQTATKNLPADIIEKIQIVDDYGDMANLTGNRTGNPERVLNIEIAPERNTGNFGNYRVGGGTTERYQLTGMYSMYQDGLQLSVLGNMNNTNASLFDFNIRGGGARRGPGGGSFGRGFGGGGGWNNNGLTNTGSIGVNYRQDLNDKLTMYGDYSFGHNNNLTLSTQIREDILPDGAALTNSNTNNGAVGNDHRFSWNIEYKPDDKQFLKLSPSFSIRNNHSNNFSLSTNEQNGILINDLSNQQINRSLAPNLGISGLYNRRLSDNGRNFFVDFSLRSSSTQQDQERILNTLLYETAIEDMDSVYQQHLVDLQNKNMNGGVTMSYIEPLGQHSNLELSYEFNFADYDNYRKANAFNASGGLIDNPEFNNERTYDYVFSTHRTGLTYRYRRDKLNYSIGAAVQPNVLRGNADIDGRRTDIHRNGFNIMPIARFEYQPARGKSFNINYSGRANEPSFTQIQPFTDYSNVNAPVTGNPNLAAEFTHEVRLNYRNFDVGTGNSMFIGLNGSFTEDKIVTDRFTFIDDSLGLVQETQYLNTDGFYNTRGFYNYSKPFSDRKYVISLNGMASYNNNVSFTNAERNIARNWVLSQGLNFRYNPKETMEVVPGVRYTYNHMRNSISERNNNNISTWALTLYSNINLTPTWIWGVDLEKTSNNGYSAAVSANPMIINTYLEKQFLKGRNGAVRIHAYDLLNEQTNVSRSISEISTIDNRSNRLARYFMLTFSYRFQRFAGGNSSMGEQPGGWGGGDGRRRPF